jgi:hypothetical protein
MRFSEAKVASQGTDVPDADIGEITFHLSK